VPGVRALGLLAGLGAVLAPMVAAAAPLRVADEHPLFQLVARERASNPAIQQFVADQLAGNVPRPPTLGEAGRSALDCVHGAHDITVDPRSGVTKATLDLDLRANGKSLSQIAFSFDAGLKVASASADGRAVTPSDYVYGPERVVTISFSPALAAGERTTLHVAYEGTLACGSRPDSGALLCTKGDAFSYFPHQAIFPYLFDPVDAQDETIDAMTRDIVLRVPSDVDVMASGEKLGETNDGVTHVASWTIDRPLARTLGLYVFAGKLGSVSIPGRSVPTTLVYPAPQEAVDQRLATWSTPVLAWVEQLTGGALPYDRSLTLVRLPADVGDPGTATFGMTLLSDSYMRAGDLMHEETWAHENTHLFWGITVPETNPQESRLMSEGMATLSQIEYSYAQHFSDQDRDRYLAQRFIPIALDLESDGKDLPAILLPHGGTLGDSYGTPAYTMWAYYKTAATLDHLRVTIGDDVFERVLGAYVQQCKYVGCSPEDLRTVVENVTTRDMGPFFDRWVTSSTRPRVTIDASGEKIIVSKGDAEPMTLELWVRMEDGRVVKQRTDLNGRETTLAIDRAQVRSVSASPRHDVMVDVRSSVNGDLDFDGETDGFDLMRCTRLVGVKHTPKSPGTGLWNVSENFDPRCDLDGNRVIDDDDITAIMKTFGRLRSP
jgi:aminopeptidase N